MDNSQSKEYLTPVSVVRNIQAPKDQWNTPVSAVKTIQVHKNRVRHSYVWNTPLSTTRPDSIRRGATWIGPQETKEMSILSVKYKVMAQSDQDFKRALQTLLEKKRESLKIAAECHEYIHSIYLYIAKFIDYLGLLLVSLSFVLSTTMGGANTTSRVNLPWTVTTGLTMLINGSKQVFDFNQKSISHGACQNAAVELADDIEYILLRENHTRATLQQAVELYEERIKSFRKTEELVPFTVKRKFIPSK